MTVFGASLFAVSVDAPDMHGAANSISAAESAGNPEEPLITTSGPVNWEIPEPTKELYGLAADTYSLHLNVGETHQLQVVWDDDCYLADSLRFISDNTSVAEADRSSESGAGRRYRNRQHHREAESRQGLYHFRRQIHPNHCGRGDGH